MNATLTRREADRALPGDIAPLPHSFLDEDLEAELARLATINAQLLARHSLTAPPRPSAERAPPLPAVATDELDRLREENAALRDRVEGLEAMAQAACAGRDETDKQREYEALLEEKTEVIRALHHKVQELQEGKGSSSGEIEHAFRELEADRRRLQEDEEALQNQMRAMETTLARERAELFRLRADLQRQQTDLEREMENASRDPQLRERLQNLQRRPEGKRTQAELPKPAPAAPTPIKTAEPSPTKKTGSGLFRRLFGGANGPDKKN